MRYPPNAVKLIHCILRDKEIRMTILSFIAIKKEVEKSRKVTIYVRINDLFHSGVVFWFIIKN